MDSLGKIPECDVSLRLPISVGVSGDVEEGDISISDSVSLEGQDRGLSLLEMSKEGWYLAAERVFDSGIVDKYQSVKNNAGELIKKPFRKIGEFFKNLRNDELMEKFFLDTMKKCPGKLFENYIEKRENLSLGDEKFWDKHPVLHGLYLAYKGMSKFPLFLFGVPKEIGQAVFAAVYADSGSKPAVGERIFSHARWTRKLREQPWFRKGMENYMKAMSIPGVGLAVSLLGPVLGVNRIARGLGEYRDGLREDNAAKKLDGKVNIVSGALLSVKPLALLGIATQGVNVVLKHSIRKGKLDPEKSDRIMTNVFAGITAPFGLAAYALLSGGKSDS